MPQLLFPMGFSHVLHMCLQGGGVYVRSGTVTITSSSIYGNRASSVRAHVQSSHRPMGDSRFARCLQDGGGVYINSGNVTITSSSIYGNRADWVRAHVQKFPCDAPTGKMLMRLGSRLLRFSLAQLLTTLSSTTEGACCSDVQKFPWPPLTHVLLLFTGWRRCLSRRWHGDFVFMQYQWEHCT